MKFGPEPLFIQFNIVACVMYLDTAKICNCNNLLSTQKLINSPRLAEQQSELTALFVAVLESNQFI